jgi:hypothetical protein
MYGIAIVPGLGSDAMSSSTATHTPIGGRFKRLFNGYSQLATSA